MTLHLRSLALRLGAVVAGPRRMTIAVAFAFGVTAVGLLAIPSATFAWDSGSFSSTSESELISLQNQARAAAGHRTLKLDTALRTIARWRSKDMSERNYFGHTIKGTTHKVFWYMQYRYDYCFKVAGENIGWLSGYSSTDQATAAIFDMFMNSSGHRANIMSTAWDSVGVGAYKGSDGKMIWTVLFADKCGSTSTATPKPTAKPTPRPTPRPTARPTAKPKPKATPRPTAKPTAKPATATATPAPTSTASPEATQTLAPILPTELPTAQPTEPPGDLAPGPADGSTSLRVVDRPADLGLVDSILQQVTAQFFGA